MDYHQPSLGGTLSFRQIIDVEGATHFIYKDKRMNNMIFLAGFVILYLLFDYVKVNLLDSDEGEIFSNLTHE